MEDGWCDTKKYVSIEKGKQKGKLQVFMTKKLNELEKMCCEMSGLVSPEMTQYI